MMFGMLDLVTPWWGLLAIGVLSIGFTFWLIRHRIDQQQGNGERVVFDRHRECDMKHDDLNSARGIIWWGGCMFLLAIVAIFFLVSECQVDQHLVRW